MKIRDSNSGDVGAEKEMVVCADLLRHGFEVFRAISGTASFDLVASLGKKLFRIEVKSETTAEKYMSHSHKADILAIVKKDRSIVYYNVPGFSIFNPEERNIYSKANVDIIRGGQHAERN